MTRNILNEGRIFINTITGGDAINISTTNSTSSTCNLKISKQTANTTISSDDLFVLETSAGDIKKITGANMKSELEQTTVVEPLLLTGNAISIKGLNGFTANKILKVNSAGTAIEYADDSDTNYWTYNSGTTTLYPDNTGDKVVIGATSITAGYTFQNMGDSYLVGDTRIKIDGSTSQVANNPLICSKSLIVRDGTAGAGFIKFFEDEDNGTNNLQLIAPASIASDCVLNLPTFTGTETLALSSAIPNLTTATNFGTALSITDPDTLNIGTGGNSSGVGTTTNIDGYNIFIGKLVSNGVPNNSGSQGADNITIQATQYYSGNPTINITAQSASGVVDTSANVNINSKLNGTGSAYITMVADTQIIMNTGFKINSSGAIIAVGSKITNNLIDTGIADNKLVEIDSSTVADNDYAKFTSVGLEGRSYSEVKTDLSLNNVENTALSTWTGSGNITTVGTIGTGVWNGTAISANYGGTGFQTYTIGDILYANTTTTLTKLNIGSNYQFLMSNGSNPVWSSGYSFTSPLGISGTSVDLGGLSGYGSTNQIIATANDGSNALQYRTLNQGTGITISHSSSAITITGPSVYWKRNTNIGSFDIETTTDVDNIDITVPFSSSSYLKATSGFTNGASSESLKYVDYVTGGSTIKVLEIFNTLNGSEATHLKFLHNSSGSYYPVIKTDTNADFIIHHENAGDRFKISRFWEYGNAYAMWYYDNSALTYFRNPSGTNSANSFAGSYFAFHNNGSAIYSNLPGGGTGTGDYHSFATGGNQFARVDATGSGKITGSWTGSWVGTSDRRLKKNIIPLTKAKETLMKINVYEFDKYDIVNYNTIHSETEKDKLLPFKDRLSKTTRKVYGFIAQELCENTEELGKMCVDTNDWGDEEPAYIIDERPMLACAIKTIQEQQQEIDTLKQEIDTLTNLVNEIKTTIDKLNSATSFKDFKSK